MQPITRYVQTCFSSPSRVKPVAARARSPSMESRAVFLNNLRHGGRPSADDAPLAYANLPQQ